MYPVPVFHCIDNSLISGLATMAAWLTNSEFQLSLLLAIFLVAFNRSLIWLPVGVLFIHGPVRTFLLVIQATVALVRACLVDLPMAVLVDFRDDFDAFLYQDSMHVAVMYCIDRNNCPWRWVPTNGADIWSAFERLVDLCLSDRVYTLCACAFMCSAVAHSVWDVYGIYLLCVKVAGLVKIAGIGAISLVIAFTRLVGKPSQESFSVACNVVIPYVITFVHTVITVCPRVDRELFTVSLDALKWILRNMLPRGYRADCEEVRMIYENVEQNEEGKSTEQDYQVADEQTTCIPSPTDISSLESNVAVIDDLKVVMEADASLVTDGVFDGVREEVEEANPSGAAPAILHALSTLESDAKDCDDSTTAKDCLSASVLVEPSVTVNSSVNASNGSLSGMDMTNLGSGCEEKKRSSAPAIPINSVFTFSVPLSMPREVPTFTFAPAIFTFGASVQAANTFTFRATSSFVERSGLAESIVIPGKEDGSALPDSIVPDDTATKRTPTQKRNRRRRAAKKRQREADAAAAAEALATPGASGSESAKSDY